jgi:cell division protein DivIC
MASKVLVSFLGTGGRAEGGKKEEYRRTKYRFPDGEIKDASLITSALFDFIKPAKLIVIGTSESVWSELIEILPEKEESSEYVKVFEEVWGGRSISPSTLEDWERFLSGKLRSKISLRLVGRDATTEIVEILYEEISNNVDLYLDITHLFRHFPLIASFLIPVLRYVKNLRDINIVYGKLVKDSPSPIVFLDEANRLVNLLEAIALVKHTGNFEKFSEILNLKDLEKLYLRMETNREINEYEAGALYKKVESFQEGNIYEVISSLVLKEDVLPYLQAKCVEE